VPDLRLERSGGVAVLTIDRPQAMNAIALTTMDEFDAAVEELEAGDDRVIVLTGAGDRAFVAGGDVKQLEAVREEEFAREMASRFRASLDRLSSLPTPVVCALNGVALGGGAEVAVACDFRLASASARIGFIQVSLAVMPAWGGIERLTALVGRARALRLLTGGEVLTAREAFECGLVEAVYPRAQFEAGWREEVERIAAAPRDVLVAIKSAVQAAAPFQRPDLAPAATRDFARLWADPAHWEAAAALERKRRAARGRAQS
jgi:enoyl-CoA hydratase/carnithine racemase